MARRRNGRKRKRYFLTPKRALLREDIGRAFGREEKDIVKN